MSRPRTTSGFRVEASKRVEGDGGPQVGEQVHFLAQAQQAGFRPRVPTQIVVLRTADGAEQDGIRVLRLVQGRVGQRGAMGVIGGAAN